VCTWQKMTLVRFSVRFCKKNCSFQFCLGFTNLIMVSFFFRLGLHLSVNVNAIFHLRLYGMTLEMTYFHAELVQLIVSWSDSELGVQRYGMKKNTLTVGPIMLQDELWMRHREKPCPNRHLCFLKTDVRHFNRVPLSAHPLLPSYLNFADLKMWVFKSHMKVIAVDLSFSFSSPSSSTLLWSPSM